MCVWGCVCVCVCVCVCLCLCGVWGFALAPRAFSCRPQGPGPERRGRSLPCQPRPGRVYNSPARAPGAAASLRTAGSRAVLPAPRLTDSRLTPPALARALPPTPPLTARAHARSRAHTLARAPLTRPYSRSGSARPAKARAPRARASRGPTASPWLT